MKAQSGFTLIELMIAVVIMAIIVGAAMPSYRKYVLRTNRSIARNFMVNVAAKEESYALQNMPTHAYATDYQYLIGTASATRVYLDNSGNISTSSGGGSIYYVDIATGTGGAGFQLTATAVGKQVNDTSCTSMSLDQLGKKVPTPGSGTSSDCWSR